MRRRELLAGAAALAATGTGAAYATGGLDVLATESVSAVELETLEAPGSEAGTMPVPERGRVTFLELFATWCDVCERTMEPVGTVYDDLGDREDLQFVSVSNEPVGNTVTHDDVAGWWAAHDGRWPLALDTDLELTGALEASGAPYSFVLDEANRVVWSSRGYEPDDDLREAILAALEGEP